MIKSDVRNLNTYTLSVDDAIKKEIVIEAFIFAMHRLELDISFSKNNKEELFYKYNEIKNGYKALRLSNKCFISESLIALDIYRKHLLKASLDDNEFKSFIDKKIISVDEQILHINSITLKS